MGKNYKVRINYIKQLRDMLASFGEEKYELDITRLDLLIQRIENDFEDDDDLDKIKITLMEDVESYLTHGKYYSAAKEFYKDGFNVDELPTPVYRKLEVSDDDTISLTRGFFKEQGDFFLDKYDDFIKQAHDHVDFINSNNNTAGEMVFVHATKEAFVFVPDYKNFKKILTFTHEAEHVIDDLSCEEFYENTYIRETAALFMEMIAADYFNEVFNLEQENLIRQLEVLNIIKTDSKYLMARYKMIKYYLKHEKMKNKKLKKNLKHLCGKDAYIINKGYSFENLYYYQLPYLIAIELYYIYKLDRNKALNILIDIILNGTDDNIFTILKKHNIVVNSHSLQYEHELTLNLSK